MSSAILYIGIVAIWAFVLVPRWLRRGPEVQEADADAGTDDWSDGESRTPPRAEPRPERVLVEHADDPAQDEFGDQTAAPVTARSRAMQSRRRLLTMLLTLTGGALACFVLKFAPWWAVIPPAGMLGFYLLLLRAAAQADTDAERARHRAAMALDRAQAQAASRAAEVVAARAPAMRPEPVAEVIDISARVGDQLYDQYADAAIRAVGD